MSNLAIRVDHLGKQYRIGASPDRYNTLRDSIVGALRTPFKRIRQGLMPTSEDEQNTIWALRDVSFDVKQGQVLGVIGRNGAGKSTLLKVLSRVTEPSAGEVEIRGRVGSLLEVGTGFHPELTGRENTYLNGAILGMPRSEIDRKFDEIIDFSGVEKFIDTPVKRYSSGMTVKLGFSIATSMDADILIIDEVLAVGDLAFQRKCFDRMEDMIKRQGKTVLLVSHNIRQVARLCSRVIIFEHGQLIEDGDPAPLCNLYYKKSDEQIRLTASSHNSETSNVRSTGDVDLLDINILDLNESDTLTIKSKEDAAVCLRLRIVNKLINPVFALGVHTTDFLYIATENSRSAHLPNILEPGTYEVLCVIRSFPLLPGTYSFRVSVSAGEIQTTIYYAENILGFQVVSDDLYSAEARNEGFFPIDIDWGIKAEN